MTHDFPSDIPAMTDQQLVEVATNYADKFLDSSPLGISTDEGTISIAGLAYDAATSDSEHTGLWTLSRKLVTNKAALYAFGEINGEWPRKTSDLSSGTWWTPGGTKIGSFYDYWGRATKNSGYSRALAETTVMVLQRAEVFDPRSV
jgi:hypothetical protein